MKGKEQVIQKAILDWLKLHHDVFAWRSSNHAVYDPVRRVFRKRPESERGMADIIGVKSGVAFAIEVKHPGGRKRPEQRAWLERFAAAGGYAYFVDSVQDVVDIFGEIKFTGIPGNNMAEVQRKNGGLQNRRL